jgi:hypothetical protein
MSKRHENWWGRIRITVGRQFVYSSLRETMPRMLLEVNRFVE